MKLINTIEISPYDYSEKEYEYPKGSSLELPDEWNEFWIKCISDKKLGNLTAIKKGSYLVDIEAINDEELEEIVKNELKEVELDDFEEQISKIFGGIVIIENEISLIEPTCCGDIGNLIEWESIFEVKSNTWHQLWIGHPWLFYKKEKGYVDFSNYTELNLDNFEDIKSKFQFSEEELKKEIERIRIGQNTFEKRIRTILNKLGINNSERIAKLMTGNE
ncbi:MAG: hypothetical protein QM535_10025 [Limnohabitans sp.]|nr:hypothetical protein [Limnohabitans sp.]